MGGGKGIEIFLGRVAHPALLHPGKRVAKTAKLKKKDRDQKTKAFLQAARTAVESARSCFGRNWEEKGAEERGKTGRGFAGAQKLKQKSQDVE